MDLHKLHLIQKKILFYCLVALFVLQVGLYPKNWGSDQAIAEVCILEKNQDRYKQKNNYSALKSNY